MKTSKVITGVAMNWLALALQVLVSFFLAPFVVHRLGNVVYGVWVLVNSIVGYLRLLDLGMGSAVVRYVSRAHAQGNHEEASQALSAALWFRIRVAAAGVVGSGIFALIFPRVFKLTPDVARDAQLALVLAACTMAVALVLGAAGTVLASFPRYDLTSGVNIGQAVLRVAGIVVLLGRGYGIVALAAWELFCALVADGIMVWLARRVYPQLKLYWSKPQPAMMQRIWHYSVWMIVLNTAVQMVYLSDNLVVGAYLSAAMVTLYAIGGSLARYADQVVSCLATTFTPLASRFEAVGDTAKLRAVVVRGTQATLLVALPILITMFFRGRTFIDLWMGHSYGELSGTVLQILVIARVFAFANLAAGGVALGMAKHKPVAVVALAEGVANVVLSIFLVRRIGIVGVAWGTTIPSLLTQVIWWPWYVSKMTNVSWREYLLQSWAKPMLTAIPFAIATWAAEQYWPASHLLQFCAQTAALCVLYAGCAYLGFRDLIRRPWQRPVSAATAA